MSPKCTSHHFWPGAIAQCITFVLHCRQTWCVNTFSRGTLLHSLTGELAYHQTVPINWAKEFKFILFHLIFSGFCMIPLVQISNKNENELSYFSNEILLVFLVFFTYWQKQRLGKKSYTADSFLLRKNNCFNLSICGISSSWLRVSQLTKNPF